MKLIAFVALALTVLGCAPPPLHPHGVGKTVTQQIVVGMAGGLPVGPNSPPEIGVVNLDGSDLLPLTNDGKEKFLPHFSPDGTKIAYTKFESGGYGAPFSRADIFVYELLTGDETQLTNDGADVQATWSPDGSQLAYLKFDTFVGNGPGALIVVDADGKNAKQIAKSPGTLDDGPWGDIAWGPDFILFTVQVNTNHCFRVRTDKIRPDGSDRTQVSDGGSDCTPKNAEQAGDADPGWSADGKTIFTSRGFAKTPHDAPAGVTERKLMSFASDATGAVADLSLAAEPDCVEGVPKASVDGVLVFRLCFGANGQPDEPGTYVTDATGSTRSFVFPGFGGDWNPARGAPAR
jgi:dipeptidyl aminopeptidase/acylaminoacyl peptidase